MSTFPHKITSERDVTGWAIDLGWPVGQPGQFVAVRVADFDDKRSSLEGWRGPKEDSEDFP